MIVVDASVVASALADDGADGAKARTRLAGERLIAPELLDLEVVSVLRRLVGGGSLTSERAAAAIADLTALPVERVSHRRLVKRCWQLHDFLTMYDAAYVALAEALGVPLVTADQKLANSRAATCRFDVLA